MRTVEEENRANWFKGSKAPEWFIDYMTNDEHLCNFIYGCIDYVCDAVEEVADMYDEDPDLVRDDAKHVGQRLAQDRLDAVVDEQSAVEFMQWYIDENFKRN